MSTSETHDKDQKTKTTPLFRNLSADQDPEVTEIESLCLQCRQNGTTRLLLTKIPFYKEVVIMSFSCNHCHWENNELQPAAKIQEKGVLYRLNVLSPRDLARIVVKTEWASVMIPELDFEIPCHSQEGIVTTVEGIIERTCTGLSQKIEYLKDEDSESASKITEFLEKLQNLKSGNTHFTFVLRDCSGNSFLENICAPLPDPQLEGSHFERSREENLLLGLYALDAETEENKAESHSQAYEENNLKDEVLGLPTNCYSCSAPCVTNMKLTHILF
ncbi:Zinc finger protein ZPR1, partial [Stegodyphus mimosarum]